MKRIKISIIWLVVVSAHMYTGTHLHLDSVFRGLTISSHKQPPTDVATWHRTPDKPPGGAGWLHRILSNRKSVTVIFNGIFDAGADTQNIQLSQSLLSRLRTIQPRPPSLLSLGSSTERGGSKRNGGCDVQSWRSQLLCYPL